MECPGRVRVPLQNGCVLKDKYEILTLIGEGGMSRVYLARDLELTNKQWAIKEVDRHAKDALGRSIEQSIIHEAELLSKIQHPTIVDIVDIVRTDEHLYVVMDHVEGESLDQVVRRSGPQSEQDVQRWMLQVCDALSYLHRQDPPIIYRDLKPNNIILHPDGYVKLIDLGIAREYQLDQRKDTVAFGTTGYAPPEQYGKAQTDARSDVYSAGATMWHLLAGQAPPVQFPLPSVRSVNPHVGEGFADVIIPRCTRIDRRERYTTCEALAADLEVYSELTRKYRHAQKRRVGIFAGLMLAAAVLALAGAACFGTRDSLISRSYEHHMGLANTQVQVQPEEAQQEFLAAIQQRPHEIDPYLGLISSYKADSAFTLEEKRQFDEVYNANLGQLQEHAHFAELSYELGRLYWYFYTYGQNGSHAENQATRIKASEDYFMRAAQDPVFEKRDTAENYACIAQFVSGIDAAVMQGDESEELYQEFWDSLVTLGEQMHEERVEAVKLGGCTFIALAVEQYLPKFKHIADVERDQIETLLDSARAQLASMQLMTEQNDEARRDALSRLDGELRTKLNALYPEHAADAELERRWR